MITQTLHIDTLSGLRPLKAPSGWKFDKTATTAWCWLVTYTGQLRGNFKRQRDRYVLEGQIHALAIVLANAVGMAPFYWEQAAKEVAYGAEGR